MLLLTVAKGGHRLTPSAQDDEAQTRGRPGELVATKISMTGLASQLSSSSGESCRTARVSRVSITSRCARRTTDSKALIRSVVPLSILTRRPLARRSRSSLA